MNGLVMMKRDYNTGVKDDAQFFVGNEVEKTATHGMKTLFVVGHHDVNTIEEHAQKHSCEHIYLGANQCFKYFGRQDDMLLQNVIPELLQNYYVTLDIPATSEPKSIVRLLTNPKFTVVYSLPVANIMNMKGNIVVKIDDTDFQATNPGVWCWSVRDLINEEHFTDWNEYGDDEIV